MDRYTNTKVKINFGGVEMKMQFDLMLFESSQICHLYR